MANDTNFRVRSIMDLEERPSLLKNLDNFIFSRKVSQFGDEYGTYRVNLSAMDEHFLSEVSSILSGFTSMSGNVDCLCALTRDDFDQLSAEGGIVSSFMYFVLSDSVWYGEKQVVGGSGKIVSCASIEEYRRIAHDPMTLYVTPDNETSGYSKDWKPYIDALWEDTEASCKALSDGITAWVDENFQRIQPPAETATTIYVSNAGDDENAGTLSSMPVKTLKTALAKIQSFRSNNASYKFKIALICESDGEVFDCGEQRLVCRHADCTGAGPTIQIFGLYQDKRPVVAFSEENPPSTLASHFTFACDAVVSNMVLSCYGQTYGRSTSSRSNWCALYVRPSQTVRIDDDVCVMNTSYALMVDGGVLNIYGVGIKIQACYTGVYCKDGGAVTVANNASTAAEAFQVVNTRICMYTNRSAANITIHGNANNHTQVRLRSNYYVFRLQSDSDGISITENDRAQSEVRLSCIGFDCLYSILGSSLTDISYVANDNSWFLSDPKKRAIVNLGDVYQGCFMSRTKFEVNEDFYSDMTDGSLSAATFYIKQ